MLVPQNAVFAGTRGIRRWLLTAGIVAVASLPALAQYAGPPVISNSPQATTPSTLLGVAAEEFRIAPGDVVGVLASGLPELTITTGVPSPGLSGGSTSQTTPGSLVSAAGEIQLPYIGRIHVAGLTAAEASDLVASRLKESGILVDPQVTVQLLASPPRIVTVTGEVGHPCTLEAFPGMRLLSALAACGGLTQFASHSLSLRRTGSPDPISINFGVDAGSASLSDILLLPGDALVVPRVGSVWVLGDVRTPQAIPLAGNSPMTVLRAITQAGGLQYSAALSKARLIRTTADNRQVEIRFDLRKLMEGKQQDTVLANNDLLIVPRNLFKGAITNGALAALSQTLYSSTIVSTLLR